MVKIENRLENSMSMVAMSTLIVRFTPILAHEVANNEIEQLTQIPMGSKVALQLHRETVTT